MIVDVLGINLYLTDEIDRKLSERVEYLLKLGFRLTGVLRGGVWQTRRKVAEPTNGNGGRNENTLENSD